MSRMITRNYLEGLNPEQREAVEHFEGPLLVLAGAGSGKTRVLTTRFAHLIEEYGVAPSAIMAVTFTNKAAGEMRDRIRGLLGHDPLGSWVGTFHSIGARLLRRHAPQLTRSGNSGRVGWSSNFSIYDSDASQREIKRVMEGLKLSLREWHPRAVQVAISGAKNQFIDPGTYAEMARDRFSRIVADIYTAYQIALREQNAFDFDDLLVKPVELFLDHRPLLAEYRARFPFILVDEYQDTNHVQYRLIKLLALGHDEGPESDDGGSVEGEPGEERRQRPANLMVVGDDDQSIYGWRGADIRNILDFEKDFPDAVTIRLEENYRSTSRILEAANQVIDQNQRRKGKVLRTALGPGELLTEVAASDEEDEAKWVVSEIQARLRDDLGRTPRDFAILYRTNAQSRALEDAFLAAGLPYQIIGGTRFYERREIMDTIAYLRLISNPRDGAAFNRVINYPRRGIGDTSQGRLVSWAMEEGLALLEAAAAAGECGTLTRSAVRALTGFAEMIAEFREMAVNLGAGELIEKVVRRVGIFEALGTEGPEGEERIDNVEELIASAYEFDESELVPDRDGLDAEDDEEESSPLDLFLQKVSLIADIDSHDSGRDTVTLMTLHNAKGLEFPVVFITGLEEGLFPISRVSEQEDPDAIEEERRLFYVGITRAMDKLYLTRTRSRRRLDSIQYSDRSSFLRSIPGELLEERTTPKLRVFGDGLDDWSGARSSRERGRWGSGSDEAPKRGTRRQRSEPGGLVIDYSEGQDLPHFSRGDIVIHPQFGRGTIREISGFGLDMKAVIEFESVGRKRVIVRYANLQKEL